MSNANYPEAKIRSVMNFTGFTRQEVLDYLHALTEFENKIKYLEEQESKMLDKWIKADRLKELSKSYTQL